MSSSSSGFLIKYDSVEEFSKLDTLSYSQHEADSWVGNITHKKAQAFSLKGMDKYVSKTEEIINKLDMILPATEGAEYIPSVCGPRFKFSEYMSGSPLFMRRRVRRVSDIAPVRIVVSLTCSARIDALTMEKRGAAILALLLKIQQVRPVELELLVETGGEGYASGWLYQLIKVESKPLAVSVAAFALCHVGFVRHLGYSNARRLTGWEDGWPFDYYTSEYSKKREERLGLSGKDIMIKEAHVDDMMLKDPVRWIQGELDRLSEVVERGEGD